MSEKLQATEQCRLWTVVIAGNDPEKDVASLTRGSSSTADIERLMVATNANVVKELKSYPDKIGILGTMLDARIIPLPILTVLSVVRKYASDALRAKMKEVSMDTRSVDSIKKTSKRLRNSELARALNSETIGLGRSGQAPGSNTIESFEKLAKIARTNDELANKALGQGLQDEGLIRSFKTEVDLGNGLTRRTDLVCETEFGKVRIEVMWRKTTSRADIANYVLQKVQNYGRALGFLK
ncbi:hypothetical protein NG799_28675 [Laspinema sp. D1]|uniref:Uncharacterized protein n=1 Tax=Laspinema palackyanum D2a TaxID=2953684 RepID=A0ABT2N3L6_9CYAN|nr:hypothetical protein [Laspinema sp. D2a]